MMTRIGPGALLFAGLAMALLSSPALAACSDSDVEAKVTQLGTLLAPLMQRNPTEAQKIADEMTAAMMQPTTEQSCALYDRLITRARR